jgi:hypothetical protein
MIRADALPNPCAQAYRVARCLLAPFRERLRRRQAIEAVVDLDRIERRRVVREPA